MFVFSDMTLATLLRECKYIVCHVIIVVTAIITHDDTDL